MDQRRPLKLFWSKTRQILIRHDKVLGYFRVVAHLRINWNYTELEYKISICKNFLLRVNVVAKAQTTCLDKYCFEIVLCMFFRNLGRRSNIAVLINCLVLVVLHWKENFGKLIFNAIFFFCFLIASFRQNMENILDKIYFVIVVTLHSSNLFSMLLVNIIILVV